jgi:iron complex transport system substrate-binding protein
VRGDWPNVSVEELVRRQPDVVVLPLGETSNRLEELKRTPGWRELRALREGRVVQLPADLLNRPGPHLGQAARALRDALHPERAGQ